MVIVAQLVRAPDCGSGGRGFDPRLSPEIKAPEFQGLFLWIKNFNLKLDQEQNLGHSNFLSKNISQSKQEEFNILHTSKSSSKVLDF